MAPISPLQSVLQTLVPALSYGARDGFAHVGTLKGFEHLVQSVATRSGTEGAGADFVTRLVEAGEGFDAGDAAHRRQAVAKLATLLSEFVELPESLRRLVDPRAPRMTPAPMPAVVAPPPASPTAAPKRAAAAKPAAKAPATPKRPQPKPRRKVGELFAEEPGVSEPSKRKDSHLEVDLKLGPRVAETEVVYPTISPSSGPLATPLSTVTPLRGSIAQALASRSITKVGEALFFFPRTYEDRREPVPIARLKLGERGVSIGTVKIVGEAPAGHRRVFRIVLGDHTGTIAATWYHYQPWLRHRYKVGERYLFSGEVRAFKGIREISHPEMELCPEPPAEGAEAAASGPDANFGRIIPVYPGFERHEQRSFRIIVQKAAEQFASAIEDPMPQDLLERLGLPALADAVKAVHFPSGTDLETLVAHQTPAQRRLAFDELFFIQLGMALRRKGVRLAPGIAFRLDAAIRARATVRVPFELTHDQQKALAEILGDMQRPEPMNRLLQGDVGSGKTAVAIVASLVAVENGYQAAFMAPTEILAEQHHRTLEAWLKPAGYRVALLTAGVPKKHKDEVKQAIASGQAQVVVGTHALLQGDVSFPRLGLVVIDEQHRFGVLQRAALMQKGVRPDVLVMTATPIPRTLAMTLYGDLDVSVIRQMPPGRQPVKTRLFSERMREKVYELVSKELAKGRQAFVVYPLVEESEKSDLQSATEGAKKIAAIFPDHPVGLLHGRMSVEEKDGVMHAFRDRRIHILVSTTVVEVGVDVPNASVMVVEAAERFGLSQLHQLRGRVGRGEERSHCFLVGATWKNEAAYQRLGVMVETNDGFVIAEKDLEIRGPGELLGTRQSGVPGLVVANLMRDQDLLQLARDEARRLVDEDPPLEKPEHVPLRRALDERWEGKVGLARVS
ncbi:MAG TPA: ATP-dependent DNA helicase RecG [Myxococcales bacterium]|jgi:ATP-dependent DNA helicase RecG